MLNKYENFFKISKTTECSLYTANSRQNGQNVLIKRFKNKLSWDEVLKNRNLVFSQKTKIFPKMIEIFKNKGQFYIVYDQPTGSSLADISNIGKMPLEHFYLLFDDLCRYIQQLKSHNPLLYVIPQWIFIHRNTIKIVHFQPFFVSKQAQSSDHVYLYKIQNKIINDEDQEPLDDEAISNGKKRDLVFNLGMIAYHLLTGKQPIKTQNQEEYQAELKQITDNVQARISKSTKDYKLSSMITKMLSKNVFERPNLPAISNYMKQRVKNIIPTHKRMHTTNIEIQIEKIRLEPLKPEPEVTPRKKLRTCCAEKEATIEQINSEFRFRKDSRTKERENPEFQNTLLNSPQKEKRKNIMTLPKIKSMRHKTKPDIMNTTMSRPLIFEIQNERRFKDF